MGERESTVPTFANMIARPLLEGMVLSASGPLIVIVAPAGFGKTVLAAQVCMSSQRRVVWISMTDRPLDSSSLVGYICEAVCGDVPCSDRGDSRSGAPSRFVCRERSTPSLLVLDDIAPDGDSDELLCALRMLRIRGLCPERILITSRSDSLSWVSKIAPSLVIDSADLTLDGASTRAMACVHGMDVLSERQLVEVGEISRGHAATIGVIARRMSLQPDACSSGLDGSLDLGAHLQALACTQLSAECLEVLFAATLLRTGDLTDLDTVVGPDARAAMRRIEACIPLVRWSETGAGDFGVHDLACSAFLDDAFVAKWVSGCDSIVSRALRVLEAGGAFARLFDLLVLLGNADELALWMQRRGRELIEQGHLCTADAVFSLLTPDQMISRPHLLLLQSEVLRVRSRYSSAMIKAGVALDLASYCGDASLEAKAHLLIARLHIDQACHDRAAQALRLALASGALADDETALANGYLMLCESDAGDSLLLGSERTLSLPSSAVVQVCTVRGCLTALLKGDMHAALEEFLALRQVEDIPWLLYLQNEGNIGATLVAMGRLDRALAYVEDVIAQCQESGVRILKFASRDSLASIRAAQGDYRLASELMLSAVTGSLECGDHFQAAWGLAHLSTWTRVSGDVVAALDYAERAAENATLTTCTWLGWVADLEIAANLVAMGESAAASRRLNVVRELAEQAGAHRYVRLADLLLGIVDGLAGCPEVGVDRIRPHLAEMRAHEDFWMPAMYARAFPVLVPMMQDATSPDGFPARLLRMIPEEIIRAAMPYCFDTTSLKQVTAMLGVAETRILKQSQNSPAPLQVRMFGGLEVTIGQRTVAKRDWRKRRARLLLAVLVLEQGRELPRDQIAGHFWPEMDEEHARNNFYVAWSAMKNALMPGSGKKNKLPYFESAHGLCRANMACIDSDITEFSSAVRTAEDARAAGNIEIGVQACERLAEVYQGELLPGDLYDDWFAPARDRCRREFGDTMLAGAIMLVQAADSPRAARLARRGIDADPWREDLYQILLRAQIDNGQRSAAIDTYVCCRAQLAEELGLDPSVETVRLYEEVLAMEEQGTAFGLGEGVE